MVNASNFSAASKAIEIHNAVKGLSTTEVRDLINSTCDKLGINLSGIDASLTNEDADLADLMLWHIEGLKLQKCEGSALHKLAEAFRSKNVVSMYSQKEMALHGDLAFQTFVVQHDWAAAFSDASDFSIGEYKLPYTGCCFEFRLSGRRVCALVSEILDAPSKLAIFVEHGDRWLLPQYTYYFDGQDWTPSQPGGEKMEDYFKGLVSSVSKQIRAICISLEAEVATTEVIRAPHRLNIQREKRGALPIRDHHVIKLMRQRAKPLCSDADSSEHRSPRLHFVRGHWRHYENSKTWIKWHLRGNEDLGFIDKDYSL